MASERPRWTDLLLLPSPPSPNLVTQDDLKELYQPAISALLRRLGSETRHSGAGVVLDVALPLPILAQNHSSPRALLYPQIQTLVAGLYKLFCVVAAQENVNVEDRDGVDVRLLLLEGVKDDPQSLPANDAESLVGTVTNITTLARCQRPWTRIFGVECENGSSISKKFHHAWTGSAKFINLPCGSKTSASQAAGDPRISTESSSSPTHYDVIIGGTFDHIHIGHKLLLTMFAFLLVPQWESKTTTKSLTIGITGDALLKEKKFPELLESWDEREASTIQFLRGIMDFRPLTEAKVEVEKLSEPGPNGHAVHSWLGEHHVIKCVEISDAYGPTITVENLTAIVVSAETRSGGKAVNEKRKEKGWASLQVFEVEVLDPTDTEVASERIENDFQAKLSSTTIRKALSERLQARSKV